MHPAPALLAAFALLALASCAEVHWQKKDGDNAALSQDLMTCRKQAMERTVRMGNPIPRSELSPVFGPLGPSPAEVRMQESQSVTACMRDKGYALESAPARAGN